jgi:hypothetical protein
MLAADKEGDLRAMTTRHKTSAIGRAASQAEPKGSSMPTTLILGTLLLLIRP